MQNAPFSRDPKEGSWCSAYRPSASGRVVWMVSQPPERSVGGGGHASPMQLASWTEGRSKDAAAVIIPAMLPPRQGLDHGCNGE